MAGAPSTGVLDRRSTNVSPTLVEVMKEVIGSARSAEGKVRAEGSAFREASPENSGLHAATGHGLLKEG